MTFEQTLHLDHTVFVRFDDGTIEFLCLTTHDQAMLLLESVSWNQLGGDLVVKKIDALTNFNVALSINLDVENGG